MYVTDDIPNDYKAKKTVTIPKKVGRDKCENYRVINPPSDTYPDTLRTDTWCLAGPLYIYMHLYASMTYLHTHFCQKQVNIFHLLPFSVVLAYYVLIRINVKKIPLTFWTERKTCFFRLFLYFILSYLNAV